MACPCGGELPSPLSSLKVQDCVAVPEVAFHDSGDLAEANAFCCRLAAMAQHVLRTQGKRDGGNG
jgi:hypothetical protein